MTTISMNARFPVPLGLDEPLEVPVSQPAHPLRLRKVLKLMRAIRTSDDPVRAGLEFFDAVGGIGGEATFQRFLKSPDGRRLLRVRPDLVALLGDREALASMPEGSLGRAYLDFAERNGFAADGLVEKNKTIERECSAGDPYREWFWDRFTMSHDLWHVLTGCPTTDFGESRLLAFSSAQTAQRGFTVLCLFIAFIHAFDFSHHRKQFAAWRAGKRAHDLVSLPWENYLAWPLDEVRRCYGVAVIEQ